MNPHRILLVGGGHTHVQVMRAFAEKPEPGCRLTLVTDRIETPYSGMLPGHVAGTYRRDEMHIDLQRLARVCDIAFVHARAAGIDRAKKTLILADGRHLAYDTLSLNVGITPDLSAIIGAEQYGLAVKPISSFLERLDARLANIGDFASIADLASIADPGRPHRFLIVGGGAAGIELALALKARLAGLAVNKDGASIGLVAGSGLVPTLNAGVRRHVANALERHKITVFAGVRVGEVSADGVLSTKGQFIPADTVILSTAARAPSWLRALGLPLAEDGSLLIHRTLATLGDEAIFAAGDCASIDGDSRPKAGVFAVRQGPFLVENLRRRVRGGALKPYHAQTAYLTLLATGDGRAIAGRGRWLALEGRWVWRWKDRIDRHFMATFNAFRR
jgi:pyridine nucleotide-disulfide oxidoreductase family protein